MPGLVSAIPPRLPPPDRRRSADEGGLRGQGQARAPGQQPPRGEPRRPDPERDPQAGRSSGAEEGENGRPT